MSKALKFVAVLIVLGGLWYSQIPQAVWALRTLYVAQTAPATKEQVEQVRAKQKELADENARLKAALDKTAGS